MRRSISTAGAIAYGPTGTLRWHYQQVPHDLWGYDVASPPVLFETEVDGKRVQAVGQAGKTGWFYVHDRKTGALLYKSEPFVLQENIFTVPGSHSKPCTWCTSAQ